MFYWWFKVIAYSVVGNGFSANAHQISSDLLSWIPNVLFGTLGLNEKNYELVKSGLNVE